MFFLKHSVDALYHIYCHTYVEEMPYGESGMRNYYMLLLSTFDCTFAVDMLLSALITLSDRQCRQLSLLPKHLSHVTWTTVTHWSVAFLKDCYKVCWRFRTLWLVLLPGFCDAIASSQYSVSWTGYQFVTRFCLKLLVLFSSHWAVEHPPTSLTTGAFYWPRTDTSFGLQISQLVSFQEHLRVLATEVLRLPAVTFGTLY